MKSFANPVKLAVERYNFFNVHYYSFTPLQIGSHTFYRMKLQPFKSSKWKATADLYAQESIMTGIKVTVQSAICEIWKKEFILN